ncbi:MAG TPA: hypothetical protein VFA70_06280 [Dehalococcoidia bacterium]|nr:hypothetical protein [Dehalococcoidia bacterium]
MNNWTCRGPCKRGGLPYDEIAVEQDVAAQSGWCLRCADVLRAAQTVEGAGFRALEQRHRAARGSVLLLRCVSCAGQYHRHEIRLDFGDDAHGRPYHAGYCIWCLSEDDLAYLHARTRGGRPAEKERAA